MKIKQIPEDFVVEEVIKLNTTESKEDYIILKLTKKNWETFKVIELLSGILKIKPKFIGFAGIKDKNAVTTQYISLFGIKRERIEKLDIKNIKFSFVGYSKNRINLGDLDGNNFKVTIRELDKAVKVPKCIYLENYFDAQRFGNKTNTHLVGKAIIKKDFKKACELLNIKVEKNYITELRKKPKKLLRFYIAAYQSYLWNKTLAKQLSRNKNKIKGEYPFGELVFVKKKVRNFNLPLINFDAVINKEGVQILKEEGVNKEDFIIREMPELITESQNRPAFVNVENIGHTWKKDELNKGKLKLELSFFLPKGSYATMLIKKLGYYL